MSLGTLKFTKIPTCGAGRGRRRVKARERESAKAYEELYEIYQEQEEVITDLETQLDTVLDEKATLEQVRPQMVDYTWTHKGARRALHTSGTYVPLYDIPYSMSFRTDFLGL